MHPRFHVIGPGRAAGGLALRLLAAGWTVDRVVSWHPDRRDEAIRRFGAGTAAEDPIEALGGGALSLIGLPDRALAPAAAEWARRAPALEGVALHLSGSLGSEVLAPLRERGLAIGSLHPAFAFSERRSSPPDLHRVQFTLEGDPAACARADEIVAVVGGRGLRVRSEDKPMHHAAAAVASNCLLAVMDLALRLDRAAGIEGPDALPGLLALARATLDNLEAQGSPAALTGPIERGELGVIEAHLAALDRWPGEEGAAARRAYRWLGRATLDLARRKGSLDEDTARRLLARLEDPR